jgi:DNA-binding transcriptional MerR regulator
MQEETSHFTIEELAEQVAVPVRTVRYYITEGLLPGPEGRGKAASYGEEHLQRLRLIRLLSNQRRPLVEIHQLLHRLSLPEICTLLADEEQRAKELAPAGQQPPQEYIATLLKNAQASRQQIFPTLGTPQPSPSATSRVYERSRTYEDGATPPGETWKHWELAPGVELHVKEEAKEQHRALIERIRQVSQDPHV